MKLDAIGKDKFQDIIIWSISLPFLQVFFYFTKMPLEHLEMYTYAMLGVILYMLTGMAFHIISKDKKTQLIIDTSLPASPQTIKEMMFTSFVLQFEEEKLSEEFLSNVLIVIVKAKIVYRQEGKAEPN